MSPWIPLMVAAQRRLRECKGQEYYAATEDWLKAYHMMRAEQASFPPNSNPGIGSVATHTCADDGTVLEIKENSRG